MVNKTPPLVSVIVAAYNAEKYINESIASILDQTYGNTEIIVVDDGSTDGTADILKSLPVSYYFQKNKGQASALNFGISMAKGDYLGFNDADDLWVAEKLELQLKEFTKNIQLDASFGMVQQFICSSLTEDQASKIHCPKMPMKGYSKLTMLIKKKSFEEIGDFNTKVKIGDFIEWFALAKRKGIQHRLIDDVLGKRRLHLDNMSVKDKSERNSFAQIMKRHLDAQKK